MPEDSYLQVSQFAEKSTAAYTKVVISRPLVLRKIMEQGYNVAWSDADIAWIRNPFTMLDKSEDVVLTEADNSQITQGAYYQHGEFAGSLAHHWPSLLALTCTQNQSSICAMILNTPQNCFGNQESISSIVLMLLALSSGC